MSMPSTAMSVQRELQTSSEASTATLPFLDLRAQFQEIRNELIAAVTGVLESQHFILGPEVEALEREIAEYVGAAFAIGCGSGSDALLLSQMALGIEPNDEIITTPFTFGATAGSIARLKARPVFVDIHPDTFNIDERQLEAVITPRSRAIMPVHLFGLPANMDALLEIGRKHNLAVIEDAAQAIGARWRQRSIGSLGTIACFSFFPSKNLGGAGDGGMIATNDEHLARRLRMLRVHGTAKKYHYDLLGINSRLDAMQAAILRVKLRYLDTWTQLRRRNAERYHEFFAEYGLMQRLALPHAQSTSFHVYNQYSIRVRRRDELQIYLRDHGIPTEVYYPSPLHVEPAFAYLGYRAGDFPNAEVACREVLSLPIYPELAVDQQRNVVRTISQFYQREL
ncbi:DegT/DnrJ/EryC1/StrS family aminotransferase [Edaphobacter aggregans]|uniref:DegT/DnrJ/EryC1/StrS family aminotransferase n=1 Tax=Edaphobacter aggregans TaxID=570835 RepID=UPI001FE14EF8|nr:DegT/DnrJ/EryC1/StrS family aminotransferase [Edaphobacter aggregans]